MTSKCIESIFSKTHDVEFEVILVDNASSDGSKDFFEKDSRIKYIYSNENQGFGRGNNLGYKYATGNYIFLLNSDTILLNNAVKEFYDFMQNAPQKIGCVGCVMQKNDGSRIHSYHTIYPCLSWIFKEILCYIIPRIYNPYKKRDLNQQKNVYPLQVAVVTGADLFIRREVLEKCGLFDSDFFMYYEETELQYRFLKHGFQSYIINTPKIIHLAGESSKNQKHILQKMQMPLKSRFIYASKIFSPIQLIIFRFMHLLMIPRILISLTSWENKKKILKILFAKYRVKRSFPD